MCACVCGGVYVITMSDVDVTNVIVFDVIRALNRVALNQNRNVVFTRSTAFCFILTVAILYGVGLDSEKRIVSEKRRKDAKRV